MTETEPTGSTTGTPTGGGPTSVPTGGGPTNVPTGGGPTPSPTDMDTTIPTVEPCAFSVSIFCNEGTTGDACEDVPRLTDAEGDECLADVEYAIQICDESTNGQVTKITSVDLFVEDCTIVGSVVEDESFPISEEHAVFGGQCFTYYTLSSTIDLCNYGFLQVFATVVGARILDDESLGEECTGEGFIAFG